MINNVVPSVVRQITSLPKTYFVRDIISYGYFGDVTRQRGTPFDQEAEQGTSSKTGFLFGVLHAPKFTPLPPHSDQPKFTGRAC